MTPIDKFDDIRPYRDEEIPAAMKRIAGSEFFPLIASYVYPDEPLEAVRHRIASHKTVEEFQKRTMHEVNDRIISNSITELTCVGLERLSPSEAYLYVSNHRDIMLDASLLQNCLVDRGFGTSEITFGANLMMGQTIIDIGRANKMFRVERPGGSVKEFYRCSRHLSEYVRYTITERNQSVWIAQRNGRTKDGRDATDQGIIKMFCMSKPDDKITALGELHIVPIAISYEWETCDILKTLELYQSRFARYTKKPGEDLTSILTRITQQKGRVHIEVCEPISTEELRAMDGLTANAYHQAVAALIDTRINSAYRLSPNNYIAYDIRYGTSKFRSRYTDSQKETFMRRLSKLEKYDSCDYEQLKEIFIGIYSNPVNEINCQQV